VQHVIDRTQLSNGMHVYDAAGHKIGVIRNYDPDLLQQGAPVRYIDVQKGFLFHKDFYVPLSAVSRITSEGAFLSLSKEELSDATYDLPPAGDDDMVTDVAGQAAGSTAGVAAAAGGLGAAAAQTAQPAVGTPIYNPEID
jgi:uncharacterized protein YrrD